MDKDKEVECGNTLRLEIFNTYWNILKRNYKDTQHNEKDFKLYYSIFRKFKEKDFISAMEQVLLHQPYFPRIDEIGKYLLKETEKNSVPKWFDEERKNEKITQQEQEEMEEILKELEG